MSWLWKATPKSTKPDPFSSQELRAIVAAADTLSPGFGLLIRCKAQSGMRSGEIRGLQWQDYDPRTGQVAISRTRTHMRTGPPKTLQSARLAAMTFPVLEETAAWMPTPTSAALLARVGSVVPLDTTFPLFPNSRGRPYDETQLHTLWKRALTRAGVRYRKPHALRASLISILLSRGAPLLMVAKQVGDSAKTMLESYATWMPQANAIPTQASPGGQQARATDSTA